MARYDDCDLYGHRFTYKQKDSWSRESNTSHSVACTRCNYGFSEPHEFYAGETAQTCLKCGWNSYLHPVVTQTIEKKEHTTMTTAPATATKPATTAPVSLTDSLRSDASDAAWRTASKTAVRVVKGPLVANISTKMSDGDKGRFLADFLQTDQGEAFLSLILGIAPQFIPQLSSDPRVVRIAAECRVRGIQYVTDEIAAIITEPIIAAFAQVAATLPSAEPAPQPAKP